MTDSALTRLAETPQSFADGWPGTPALLHGDAAWARSLLSLGDVDTLIAQTVLPSRLVMAKDSGFLDRGDFSTGDGRLNPAGIAEQLAAGASMLLVGLELCWAPLVTLCRELTGELGHPVRANSYLTPPDSQGFAHHWDDHSSFLVQTEGVKVWQLHPPIAADVSRPRSFSVDEFAALRADGTIRDERFQHHELRAGDVLWLPRGWIHDGRTNDEWSLHVTLGVSAIMPSALFKHVLELAASDPRSRVALPPATGETNLADAERVRGVLAEIVADLDVTTLADAIAPLLPRRPVDPGARPVATAVAR